MSRAYPVAFIVLVTPVLGNGCGGRHQPVATAGDSAFRATQARGQAVMGVDQYTSAHIFEDLDDGGRIVLERDDAGDRAGIATIRDHMRGIAVAFRAGDFSKPFRVHAQAVPGTAVMAARRRVIQYDAVDRPRGAEVRLHSSDPVAIAAIHEFLAFQRGAHHAAGHEGMGGPPAQDTPPRILYIYRDSLKRGVDSTYRAIEDRAARICADLKCPNPYLALESLSEPHEAWWINAFTGAADTTRVVKAYAENRPLMEELAMVTKRKAGLIGTPIKGYAVYRPDLSRGQTWSVAGARFMLVTVTRNGRPADGSVWEAVDSTLYVFRPVKTRRQAEALARTQGARLFAVRPSWSMPAPEWAAADPDFWRSTPASSPSH